MIQAVVAGATTNYTWDVGASLPVILQDGTYTNVYGLGLISQTDGSGNQTYMLPDGTKSNEVLTNGSGTVSKSYKYDVFGGGAALRALAPQSSGTLPSSSMTRSTSSTCGRAIMTLQRAAS